MVPINTTATDELGCIPLKSFRIFTMVATVVAVAVAVASMYSKVFAELTFRQNVAIEVAS